MAAYSGTPLIKKLGIKERFRIRGVHVLVHYSELLGNLPLGVEAAQRNTIG